MVSDAASGFPIPTLESERLKLRAPVLEDAAHMARWLGDATTVQFVGDGAVSTPGAAWRSLASVAGHWHLRGFGLWIVELRETGEPVGRVGLYYPGDWPDVELGWLIDPAHWGRGFAPEAALAARTWGRAHLGDIRLISLIHPDNLASIRVAEKLGARHDGHWSLYGVEASVYCHPIEA